MESLREMQRAVEGFAEWSTADRHLLRAALVRAVDYGCERRAQREAKYRRRPLLVPEDTARGPAGGPAYRHEVCGVENELPSFMAESSARQAKLWCFGCGQYVPTQELEWIRSGR